jgi:outer membrane protein TolC
MTFTGTPIKLSLDAAYKKMLADSSGAKMADLNKQKALGVANGYGESVRLINKSEDAGGDYSSTDKNILRIQQEFAKTQADRDYQAEINKLKNDTLENYYTLKELENQVQIAKDNLALKEKLLSNTQLKFKLGTVSKSDVLKAETSVFEAKDSLLAAQNGYNKMKMGFNQFMGYALMQNVTLTDSITEIALPEKTLAASIKDALSNRNEIKEAAYNLKVATLNLNNYKAYPGSSSKYVKAKMSMLMAETAHTNAPLTVESDVRNKFMAMNAKYSAVQTGKKAVENAKETERLTRLQYDAGMATLSDVETAQLGLYNEQLGFSKTLLQYNLAVNDYVLSSSVGAPTSSFQE